MDKLLSIIVPVFNVERYISKCIESLFCQGLSDDCFEVIIVNDGTKDNSMELISNVVSQHTNVKIINQKNQGLSMARNNGLAHAVGRYVMFVDSDDFLIDNSLSVILPKALDSSVDLVIADYVKMTDNDIEQSSAIISSQSIQSTMLYGREAFLHCLKPDQCFVWRALYRRAFLEENHLNFISGLYFEDIPFSVECYLKTEKTILYPIPLYVYRQHSNSIVSTVNKKKIIDFNRVIAYVFALQKSMCLSKGESNKLSDIAFSTFSIEMWYLIHEKGMYSYRREIVRDLKERVPNLFFENGLEQYLTSIFFKWMPYTYLKIRYLLGK